MNKITLIIGMNTNFCSGYINNIMVKIEYTKAVGNNFDSTNAVKQNNRVEDARCRIDNATSISKSAI